MGEPILRTPYTIEITTCSLAPCEHHVRLEPGLVPGHAVPLLRAESETDWHAGGVGKDGARAYRIRFVPWIPRFITLSPHYIPRLPPTRLDIRPDLSARWIIASAVRRMPVLTCSMVWRSCGAAWEGWWRRVCNSADLVCILVVPTWRYVLTILVRLCLFQEGRLGLDPGASRALDSAGIVAKEIDSGSTSHWGIPDKELKVATAITEYTIMLIIYGVRNTVQIEAIN